ncbi:ATPase, T2SS/T4P/T4SS family [Candidatus Glomeribacter gigasporarum]|nr:ATPase, T2SS/T4P/T4SS family [Candidatus Glomeribacter gigasporarum]
MIAEIRIACFEVLMNTQKISALEFVDLYIGEEYCDIKGLAGASASRVGAPDELKDQINALRQQCQVIYRAQQEPEFALILDGVLFRVTQISDVANEDVFILRRSCAQIRPLATLGLAPHVMRALLEPQTRGLILIAGEMGTGKTSTAASIVVQRLKDHGGIAIAVEDPPETRLNGLHGHGRCIQVRASRKSGGYQEHMIRAMRSGADLILIGEIRDEDTAFQALQASINGHLIIATIHAGDIVQAIERMQTFCNGRASNTNDILADGLTIVIWQTLERISRAGDGQGARFISKSLVFSGPESAGIRARIRKGLIGQVMQNVETQSRQAAWNLQNTFGGE